MNVVKSLCWVCKIVIRRLKLSLRLLRNFLNCGITFLWFAVFYQRHRTHSLTATLESAFRFQCKRRPHLNGPPEKSPAAWADAAAVRAVFAGRLVAHLALGPEASAAGIFKPVFRLERELRRRERARLRVERVWRRVRRRRRLGARRIVGRLTRG